MVRDSQCHNFCASKYSVKPKSVCWCAKTHFIILVFLQLRNILHIHHRQTQCAGPVAGPCLPALCSLLHRPSLHCKATTIHLHKGAMPPPPSLIHIEGREKPVHSAGMQLPILQNQSQGGSLGGVKWPLYFKSEVRFGL